MVVKNLVDEAYANSPHTQRFTVLDDDAAGDPPLDLTGRVIKWGMVPFDEETGDFPETPLTLDYSIAGGQVVITDGPAGEVDVNIPPADTTALSRIKYYFELEVFDAGGLNGVPVATGTLDLLRNLQNA